MSYLAHPSNMLALEPAVYAHEHLAVPVTQPSSRRTSAEVVVFSTPATVPQIPTAQPPAPANSGFGARIMKSLARARAAVTQGPPPTYARGAWAIINDVPYPPPPPYASSRHPPTYDEALEIGVVASPLRVEQHMRQCQRRRQQLPRVSSAPQLTALQLQTPEPEDTLLPDVPEEVMALPSYDDVDETVLLSPVVKKWQLGQPAFEKPALHPKGYAYVDADNEN
ncbi:hypothetical protein GGF46_000585 [Coemansia sp. RSA 552]|nr:hypothetical protein GGF46_000585 [Coemansia sp. RSA 552]